MIEIPENPAWDEFSIPTLANIKKHDEYTLYIGRENQWLGLEGSKWGNPFKLERESEREKVLRDHWNWFEEQEDLIAALPELANQVLGCYCFNSKTGHGKKCHGMNLIRAYKKYVLKIDEDGK
jgi:hypothetical protein